jgi:hypothetical protein
VRPTEEQGNTETLGRPDNDVSTHLTRRLDKREGKWVSRDNGFRAGCVNSGY